MKLTSITSALLLILTPPALAAGEPGKAASPSAAPPAEVSLALAGHGDPLTYWVQTQERVAKHKLEEQPKWGTMDFLSMRSQTVGVTEAGNLVVDVKTTGPNMLVNGKRVPGTVSAPGSLQYELSPRGEFRSEVDENQVTGPEKRFFPQLPPAPVKPGARWDVHLPPSKEYPFELHLVHHFVGEDEIDGTPCWQVYTTADGDETEPKSSAKIAVKVRSNLWLDKERGVLVRSLTTTEMTITLPRPNAQGIQVSRRNTSRLVKLEPPKTE